MVEPSNPKRLGNHDWTANHQFKPLIRSQKKDQKKFIDKKENTFLKFSYKIDLSDLGLPENGYKFFHFLDTTFAERKMTLKETNC